MRHLPFHLGHWPWAQECHRGKNTAVRPYREKERVCTTPWQTYHMGPLPPWPPDTPAHTECSNSYKGNTGGFTCSEMSTRASPHAPTVLKPKYLVPSPLGNYFHCPCLTVITVIIDHFSKSLHLIPLQGLLSAFKTAELHFNNVFRYFGFTEDIMSGRGVQFTSCVWGIHGETVRLTLGYHPQDNGQVERVNQEIGCFLWMLFSENWVCAELPLANSN